MPVETFGYPDSLNASFPPTSDGLVGGDDHIRGIKSTIKNTFPNISGAVTGTQAQLNTAAGWTTSGASLLNHSGVFFDNGSGAASTDGFANTLAGDIDVVLQGVIAATFQRTGGVNFFKVKGALQVDTTITATGEIKGPGICPPGSTVIWWDDVLPSDGLWAWANGQVLANANTVAPILLARWGSRFGGNGTTTMGLPDLRETAPIGKSTMGGTVRRGLLVSISDALVNAINGIFGAATVALTTAEMPSHYHTAAIYDPGHTHGHNAKTGQSSTGGGQFPCGADAGATINAAATGVRVNSSNGFDTTNSTGSGNAHNNVQPSSVVNWIIRIG